MNAFVSWTTTPSIDPALDAYKLKILKKNHFSVIVDKGSLGSMSIGFCPILRFPLLQRLRDLLMRHHKLSRHELPLEKTTIHTSEMDPSMVEER